jgi:ribosomal protein S18 acetylase RimI-like enzyme
MRIEAATEATPELLEALISLLPQLNPELPPLTMERLVNVVRDPATTLLVARDGDTVAGTATVLVYSTPAHRKARIEDVVIDEDARGKGAGEALVRRCVEVAREKGAEIVELQSARWREVANRLYLRLAFERRDSNLYRLNL